MIEYAFYARVAGRETPSVMRQVLASDLDASVRSYDLLRNHAQYASVAVYCDGRPILQRSRAASKIEIAWAPGFPRPGHLAASGRRKP